MALETILEKLIAAVEANTAAVKAMGGAAPATAPKAAAAAPAAKPKAAAAAASSEPAVDFETVKAAGVKVMDTLGKPFAKKLIKEVTGADALPAVKKEKYGALVKAFEKALEDAAEGGEAEEEEDEDL